MIFKQIKYYISCFLVGIALVSCSSSEELDVAPCEVSFDVQSLTRSSLTTSDNITAKSFAVFGDMIHQDLASENSKRILVFNGAKVEYKNNGWTIGEKQYWFPFHEHSFVAIHPASVLSETGANTNYENSQLSFTYTLPENPDDATDILMATHRRQYATGDTSVVSFRFAHLLSLVNVSLAFDNNVLSNDTYLLLRKAEFSGVKTKADINIIPAPILSAKQTNDITFDIKAQSAGTNNYTIEFAEPVKVSNNRTYVVLLNALIMIPQDFANDTEAKLSFSYTVNDDSSIKQIELPLKELKWNSGKSQSYRLLFDNRGLHAEGTTINPWSSLSAGDINAR